MRDFDRLALDWYRQHLDEIATGDMQTVMDTVVDVADTIADAIEHGATLDEIAAVLDLPVDDVAALTTR